MKFLNICSLDEPKFAAITIQMKSLSNLITPLFATVLMLAPAASAQALRDRVCSFYRGETVIERKTCKVDYFNSGSIKIYTNNGALNFDSLSARGKVYNLKFNGSIWAHTSNPEKLVCMTACGTEGNKLPWYKLVWSQ